MIRLPFENFALQTKVTLDHFRQPLSDDSVRLYQTGASDAYRIYAVVNDLTQGAPLPLHFP